MSAQVQPPSSSPLRRILFAQESGLVLVIILMMAGLSFFGGTKNKRLPDPANPGQWTTVEVNKFLDAENLVLLAKDASFVAIMAVGMTAVIVMGGIDLSVGSIYAVAALLGAMALRALQSQWGGQVAPAYLSIPLGVGLCGLAGAACGALNGSMVVGLRVHPFIITLGMMAVLRGVAFVSTKGQSIVGFPESYTSGFFKAQFFGVRPVPVLVMLAVVLAGHLILTRFLLGRRTYAIGGNETAAQYAGIPVGRVKIIVYTLMGMLAGLSGAVSLGYLGAATSNDGMGYELNVIAAAVIGGASLTGGRGTALGAVLGAILIQLITNAMLILDIDTNYTQIVMGIATVAAVVLDQVKARFLPSGR